MSDSNPIAVLERTSLIVYEADVFNCSPHYLDGRAKIAWTKLREQRTTKVVRANRWAATKVKPEQASIVQTWKPTLSKKGKGRRGLGYQPTRSQAVPPG
jgi:hypothetical protein